jgi:hypothetical protein
MRLSLLSLHPHKTKEMLFGIPQKLRHSQIYYNNRRQKTYKQVNCLKYLGKKLDPHLHWNEHAGLVTGKWLSGHAALKTLSPRAASWQSTTTMITHLDNCATVWLPTLHQCNKTGFNQPPGVHQSSSQSLWPMGPASAGTTMAFQGSLQFFGPLLSDKLDLSTQQLASMSTIKRALYKSRLM